MFMKYNFTYICEVLYRSLDNKKIHKLETPIEPSTYLINIFVQVVHLHQSKKIKKN